MKKMESQLAAAREGMRARLSKSKQVTASKSAPPRYDEIYAEGVKALDELAEVERPLNAQEIASRRSSTRGGSRPRRALGAKS